MFQYSVFGFSIHSELFFPNLPPGSEQPDIIIRYGCVPHITAKATMNEEIAHHARGGSFHIRTGREIIVDPKPGADPDLLRALLMGRMMAFLLRQRGWLPLHASGVAVGGEAVLFLGISGAGKSTVAAAFHARGHQVITDDVGAVRFEQGQCLICPAGPRIRLFDDALDAFAGTTPPGIRQWRKSVFDVRREQAQKSIRVRRLYLLNDGDQISSEELAPLTAVATLSIHSIIRRERMDEESLSIHLRDCAMVAQRVPIRRLVRPRSLNALPAVVRFVESDLSS